MPKPMAPCSALHIRLIRALHNFLQGRGAIVVGPPYKRLPFPGSSLRYDLAQGHDNQCRGHCHNCHLSDNDNYFNTSL